MNKDIIMSVEFIDEVGLNYCQKVKCNHSNTHYEDWPGGSIEVCDDCKMSRYHDWEYGQSEWIVVNIEEARKEVQKSIDQMLEERDKV